MSFNPARSHWRFSSIFIALVFSLSAFFVIPALAQGGEIAIISEIVTDRFPAITFNLAVYDQQGNFINNLEPSNVRIQENDNALDPDSLVFSEPGLQVIVAVNPAPALGYFADQVTRFDNIRQALVQWASSRSANELDDYSFVTDTGVVESRLNDPSIFQQVLESYSPDFAQSTQNLQSLAAALDLAVEPNPRPYMRRAILYITPLPTDDQLPGLTDMAGRAGQLGVKIFVWLVAYPSSANAPSAEVLRQLAARTGGQFFLYSGIETLPQLESYFLSLRGIYTVTYSSSLAQSGVNTLSVSIQHQNATITSSPATFEINILPPNPFLLSPPSEIDRDWSSGKAVAEDLTPASVDLNYLVEFPDGYDRPIRLLRFFVDGQLQLEITDPINQKLTWQLPAETETSTHMVYVEVTDSLGLTGESLEIPIQIVVPEPPRTWFQNMVGYFTGTRLLILAAVVISAAVLVAVLVLTSRGYKFNLAHQPARHLYKDPVTQPVNMRNEKKSPQRETATPVNPVLPVLARFIPLARTNDTTGRPLIVRKEKESIGSDSRQVSLVIDFTSISPIHARIELNSSGYFILFDEDSTAGTWVNYAPISRRGIKLEHNDLVSFGKTTYRFEILRDTKSRISDTGRDA